MAGTMLGAKTIYKFEQDTICALKKLAVEMR